MDSSRRAVESYWRSRMIDGATSDEDKVTPVYKLEEICELLRSSHVSIVKEVSEFIFKRLEHKSPVVKQKALRLIKYAVVKSGTEFRREMQRHSVAVRQLIHYKGQPDPLKGDALNKGVRETAQEALSAIFSSDDSRPVASESLGSRIQGFGNTNFDMPLEDKKSFLSEVVGLGSATIKQSLSTLAQTQSVKKNDTGSYRSPNLRRSLTIEGNYPDRYEGVGHYSDSQKTRNTSPFSGNATGGTWSQDLNSTQMGTTHGDSGPSLAGKTREERLLETIVTTGGVRLQPTRDALQVFLVEAAKLDALALSHALELKLQSHLWQIRMKAVCVLEAILRKKGDEQFSAVAYYFNENRDVVLRCSESPQASLREKANKVLSLLDGEESGGGLSNPEYPGKSEKATVQMPDLIDTGDPDDGHGMEDAVCDNNIAKLTITSSVVDDLFGDSLGTPVSTSEHKSDDDPFADVSFHSNNDKDHVTDLFSGMSVSKQEASEFYATAGKNEPELFDVFGSNSEPSEDQGEQKGDFNDLMAGLSLNENDSWVNPNQTSSGAVSGDIFSATTTKSSNKISNVAFNGMLGSQSAGLNPNPISPLGSMPYNIPSGLMFNPAFSPHPVNYDSMGSLFAQQQFLSTMANFQQLGNLQFQNHGGGNASGTKGGIYSSPLPDVFNPSLQAEAPSSMMSNLKKEDTKAFDFISDHLASARDPKRVV